VVCTKTQSRSFSFNLVPDPIYPSEGGKIHPFQEPSTTNKVETLDETTTTQDDVNFNSTKCTEAAVGVRRTVLCHWVLLKVTHSLLLPPG